MKLKIKVKPNSGKQEIVKISDDEYTVCLKKPAEDNKLSQVQFDSPEIQIKANVELCKLLQRYFQREVRIKSGFTNKNKIIEVI